VILLCYLRFYKGNVVIPIDLFAGRGGARSVIGPFVFLDRKKVLYYLDYLLKRIHFRILAELINALYQANDGKRRYGQGPDYL